MTLHLLFVDSDAIFLENTKKFLLKEQFTAEITCAHTRREALRLLSQNNFQILLLDLRLQDGNGMELIRQALALQGNLDVMVLSNLSDEQHVMSAIEAGAMGYWLKSEPIENLPRSLRLLQGGGSPVSPAVARSVLRAIRRRTSSELQPDRPIRHTSDMPALSKRETEILQLLAKGMSFSEIGDILSISPHTVTAHIKKIYRKLQVHSRGEAVYEASVMGLVQK